MLEHIAKAVEAFKTVRGAKDFYALRDPTEPKNLILYQSCAFMGPDCDGAACPI
jgi:hypothetical protein